MVGGLPPAGLACRGVGGDRLRPGFPGPRVLPAEAVGGEGETRERFREADGYRKIPADERMEAWRSG